ALEDAPTGVAIELGPRIADVERDAAAAVRTREATHAEVDLDNGSGFAERRLRGEGSCPLCEREVPILPFFVKDQLERLRRRARRQCCHRARRAETDDGNEHHEQRRRSQLL